jgi:hypothetical protein
MPIPVLAPSIDRILWFASKEEASRLLRRGQATQESTHRALRLRAEVDADVPMRTRTGRVRPDAADDDPARMLAAIGQSQVYTTRNERRRVDGFKSIYPEDLHIFHAATLGGWV